MLVLRIRQFGDPVLRTAAEEVLVDNDTLPRLRRLSKSMQLTVDAAESIGLAAPQIGKSVRLFLMHIHATKFQPGLKTDVLHTVINPEIISFSDIIMEDWEGCLSLPGVYGRVPRAESVSVRYYDLSGNRRHEDFSGLEARVFQHEFDHLKGVLFVDRMKDMTTLVTGRELMRILKAEQPIRKEDETG